MSKNRSVRFVFSVETVLVGSSGQQVSLNTTVGGGGRDAGRGVNQCLSLKCRREKNKGIANISPVAELSSTLPQTP